MPELVHFQTIEIPDLLAVGKNIRVRLGPDMSVIGERWGKYTQDGTFDTLKALAGFIHDPAYVGFMNGYDPATNEMNYLIGMLMKPGVPVPEGFTSFAVPAGKVGVGWIKGRQDNVSEICHRGWELTGNKIKETGMATKWCWGMEVYTSRFNSPDADGNIIVDIWLPVK